MSNIKCIALDGMGGDFAPQITVKGAVDAVNSRDDVKVLITGIPEKLNEELAKYTYPKDRLEVVPASEVIEMAETPTMAIRRKKDSSLVVAMNLVKEGKADAIVSAGSTGAILVGGQVIVGRIKGVDRAPLAPLVPVRSGVSLLVDCGANVDAKPHNLVQFAKMGSIYMKYIQGIDNPSVGIVNIGAEEEKGNALVKETFPMLKECEDLNFIGSVEARDILEGGTDVLVCDAFVGNIVLKMVEGVAKTLLGMEKDGMMASLRGKIGGMLIKPVLKGILKKFDADEHGGAPLLGLKKLVFKCHGSSSSLAIKNGIIKCAIFCDQDVTGKIEEAILAEMKEGQ